jgi:hypothetical protein
VQTASVATAIQVVQSNRRGSREIEHIGSAHSPAEVQVLETVARQRLHANRDTLDFGDGRLGDDEAPIVTSQARHLWEMLTTAYRVLGLDRPCADEVFEQLPSRPPERAFAARRTCQTGVARSRPLYGASSNRPCRQIARASLLQRMAVGDLCTGITVDQSYLWLYHHSASPWSRTRRS